MKAGYFITGTDTGVGKTLIATALLQLFNAAGFKTAAMKPVASGCADEGDGLRNADASALMKTASIDCDYGAVNPYAFAPAIAPHIAAARAGVTINMDTLVARFEAHAARADVVVVEGIGGWQVPLNDSETMANLAVRIKLPVVLVVGLRLGCLSHALLTADAIRQCGLPLAGWVANNLDADFEAPEDNIAALAARLSAPCLGVVPGLAGTGDRGNAAEFLRRGCEQLIP
jgi:dethiobiotin synthetase